MPKILVTIDTEIGELGKNRPDAFEIFIEGKADGKEAGYKLIMDILEKYNVKGEFFVDVYPCKVMGEERFEVLCRNIFQRGHNVGLHTHPSTAFDINREFMYQYALAEQVEILNFGKEKIKKWIGKYPTSHRAGGYGINEDTLLAIAKSGIRCDGSYFYGNKNCKFKSDFKNRTFEINGVLEVPVTGFYKKINYKLCGVNLLTRSNFQKLDIRYGTGLEEIKEIISRSDKDDILVLFLHSFNFLNLPYNLASKKYGKITVNQKMIKAFEELISTLSYDKKCVFTTFDNLAFDSNNKDRVQEIVSTGNAAVQIYKSLREKILRKIDA